MTIGERRNSATKTLSLMTINVPEMGVKYTRDRCEILLNTGVDENEA